MWLLRSKVGVSENDAPEERYLLESDTRIVFQRYIMIWQFDIDIVALHRWFEKLKLVQ